MAECEWAIVCDYSFMDVNRKTCLIGVFDRIVSNKVPVTNQTAVAIRLVGDPGEQVGVRIELVRPSGGILAQLNGQSVLGETGAGEFQLNFSGLLLPDWGLYAFNIYFNDRLEKTAGFSLTEAPNSRDNNPPHLRF